VVVDFFLISIKHHSTMPCHGEPFQLFPPPQHHSERSWTESNKMIKRVAFPSKRVYNASLSMKVGGVRCMSNGIDKEYWNRAGSWDDKYLSSLFDANKAWAERMHTENFFEENSHGHAPKILWIGCSDARVPANQIIGEKPGNVFVHRNIANQVVNTDFNCLSVIQYAVDVLQVKHIIVCGHYDCGGVKAALTNNDHNAPLENWLRNIRDIYRNNFDELSAITDENEKRKRLVEISTVGKYSYTYSY
jgi:carbonic anhydrase